MAPDRPGRGCGSHRRGGRGGARRALPCPGGHQPPQCRHPGLGPARGGCAQQRLPPRSDRRRFPHRHGHPHPARKSRDRAHAPRRRAHLSGRVLALVLVLCARLPERGRARVRAVCPMTSVFELFKIGIGPSSSHTVGPMVAAKRFMDEMNREALSPARIVVEIYGSLAWTGRGHSTDTAICLGLMGEAPAAIDPNDVAALVHHVRETKRVPVRDGISARFDPAEDIVFNMTDVLPGHSNGMRFSAFDASGATLAESVFYSIGGGFVVRDGETEAAKAGAEPHPFACIDRGLAMEGELPGSLRVKRRAKGLHERLLNARGQNQRAPHEVMDWVSTYAIAVNEENASGGRVVTAPTNGAAGIVPAVLRYCRDFCAEYTPEGSHTFLLTAAAIGSLIKRNASISGAEVGCQGEVGSAASMASAGLGGGVGGAPAPDREAAGE